jgi:hypothetical protein
MLSEAGSPYLLAPPASPVAPATHFEPVAFLKKHKNALIAAFFFCNYEGVFWLYSKDFYIGAYAQGFTLLIAMLCMAAFLTYTGKVARNERA